MMLMLVLSTLIVLAAYSYVIRRTMELLVENVKEEDVEAAAEVIIALRSGKLPSLTDSNLLNVKFSELIDKMNNSTSLQKP